MIQSDMKEKPYEAESSGTSYDASENTEICRGMFTHYLGLCLDGSSQEPVCVKWSS